MFWDQNTKRQFVYSDYPWFDRSGGNGGAGGTGTGVFAFGHDHGSVDINISFRELTKS